MVELVRTESFFLTALGIAEGSRVFDQCCGNGRLSHYLAPLGVDIVGIDLAQGYIDLANQRTSEGMRCQFEAADAFTYVVDPPCDAAFNWWTSFGYTASDAKNLEMLQRAFESLRTGGRFALDFMNVPGVLRHFQPSVITRAPSKDGEITLLRESRLDLGKGVLHKRWTYYQNDTQKAEFDSQVRLYDPPKLVELFVAAGFTDIEVYGDLDQSSIQLDSPRCIVTATRP